MLSLVLKEETLAFEDLPWFVREDIVKLVIEEEPKYCRVNREWLKLVATKYGLVNFNPKPPETKNPNTLFTQHIKTIYFFRTSNINWEFVYSLKRVNKVQILLEQGITSINCDELIIRCLQLPPLEYLVFSLFDSNKINLFPLIKNNQTSLISLSISLVHLKHFLFNPIQLQNLVNLSTDDFSSADIHSLTKRMPNLKSLSTVFVEPEDSILFTDYELPNLTKLHLNNFDTPFIIKVNLVNFNKLEHLILEGDFELVGKHAYNKIYKLEINQTAQFHQNLLYPRFPNVRYFSLNCHEDQTITKAWNMLQSFTNVRKVSLKLERFDNLEYLLPSPSSIIDLKLTGYVYTTTNLLHWMSTSFNLQKLDLHACFLKDRYFHRVPRFEHLNGIRIRTHPRFISLFTQSFNKETHPHISFLEISSCNCNV